MEINRINNNDKIFETGKIKDVKEKVSEYEKNINNIKVSKHIAKGFDLNTNFINHINKYNLNNKSENKIEKNYLSVFNKELEERIDDIKNIEIERENKVEKIKELIKNGNYQINIIKVINKWFEDIK